MKYASCKYKCLLFFVFCFQSNKGEIALQPQKNEVHMLMHLLFTKEIAIYDTILNLSREIPCISGTVRTEQNHSVS